MTESIENFLLNKNFKSIIGCIEFLFSIGFSLEESYRLSSELFDLKINIPTVELTGSELFFVECLNGCEIEIDKEYPNSIFYKKNGQFWFLQDLKNERFWSSYDKVWSIFQSRFDWDNQQIRTFIKDMLERHLGLEDSTSNNFCEILPISWKDIFD